MKAIELYKICKKINNLEYDTIGLTEKERNVFNMLCGEKKYKLREIKNILNISYARIVQQFLCALKKLKIDK